MNINQKVWEFDYDKIRYNVRQPMHDAVLSHVKAIVSHNARLFFIGRFEALPVRGLIKDEVRDATHETKNGR